MTGKPNGRPPHKPTAEGRKSVEAMAGFGIPHDDIGKVIGVTAVTLAKHYRKQLDTGHIKANSRVAESLYKMATGDETKKIAPNVTAAIWWTKTRMGWSETMKHTGEDGGAIKMIISREDAKL